MSKEKNMNSLNLNDLEGINGGVGTNYHMAFPTVKPTDRCDNFVRCEYSDDSDPRGCRTCQYFLQDETMKNVYYCTDKA